MGTPWPGLRRIASEKGASSVAQNGLGHANATASATPKVSLNLDALPRYLGIMRIAPPASPSDVKWLSLRSRLWPQASEAEQLRDMGEALARGHCVRLAFAQNGSAAGFVEASKRVDYVNGTSTSPVAFLEGLYVEPTSRRKGVARALVAEIERWALAERCSELASDSPLENVVAHAAHRALGFEETERVVYFRRVLRGA